ncbi:MAG: tetratricopeptide repeat protein [bacterium]
MQVAYSRKRAVILTVIFMAALSSGCWPRKPVSRNVLVPGDGERKNLKPLPNILLISIDTLRADHLGCYGYRGIPTPHIDHLAREGMLVTSCYTPVPITLPSHATLMTGQYPLAHNVRDNGTFRLGEESLTLAEILKSKGYQTAAFVGAFVLDSRFGLDQGFDIYDDQMELEGKKSDLLFEERRAEEVIGAAGNWLDQKQPGPFFLFIHCFDPHAPYHAPAPYGRGIEGCDDPANLASCYDQEIAYTDDCLGRLFEKMKELGIFDQTLICFTADHGESLGEHGEPSHSVFVYDSTIHVPLIIRYPEKIPRAERFLRQVSSVSIAPTILDMAGIHLADSKMQGESLWSMKTAAGQASSQDPDKEAIYCETYFPFYNHHWSPLQGVRTSEWKYVKAPKPELYQLANDPRELSNLFSYRQDQVAVMEKLLDGMKKKYSLQGSREKAHVMVMDEDTRRRLERLGYLWTAPAQEDPVKKEIGNYPDPKDMVVVLNYFNVAAYHYLRYEYDQAIGFFHKSLEIDPKDVFAHFMIGFIYNKTGQFEKARDEFLECIRLDPAYLNGYVNLGGVYLKLGQKEKAFEQIEKARKLDPESIEIYQNLGVLYSYSGEYDKAIEAFHEALKRDARHIEALRGLAGVYLAKKDYAAALQHAGKAIELDPQNVDAYNTLGAIYLAQGKITEAEEKIRQALKFDSRRVDTLLNLADVHIQKEEYSLARQEISRVQEIDPDVAKAYNALGIISLKEEDYSQALRQFQKAQQLEPGSAEILYNLGLCYSRLNDSDRAVQSLQKAIELDPGNLKARISLGVTFHHQQKFDQAIDAYQSALKLDPDNIDTLFQLGLACQDKGDSEQAINIYKQVLVKDARHLNAHIKLSLLYFALGQTDLGIEECRRILEIDPANEAAHINLGFTFFQQKEFDRAIAEYSQAIQNNPDNPVTYFHMANCYLWKQDLSRGIEYLQAALRVKPDFQPAKDLLDQIQSSLGSENQ